MRERLGAAAAAVAVALCCSSLAVARGDDFEAVRGPARHRSAGAVFSGIRLHRFARIAGADNETQADTSRIDPEAFLGGVNKVREDVGSPPLEWDSKLAATAEKWAAVLQLDGCHMAHSTHDWTMREYAKQGGGYEPLGESLAWACCDDPPKQGGADVVGMWEGEKRGYAYGPLGAACTSPGGAPTGEYTQMVWAGTQKMGCGMATCADHDTGLDKGTVWVCHFFPAGNVVGELPFCADAVPEGMDECEGVATVKQPEGCGTRGGGGGDKEKEEEQAKKEVQAQEEEEAADKERSEEANKVAEAEGKGAAEGGGGGDDALAIKEDITVVGLSAEDFDKIVFAGAVAESLDVPLYKVTVQDPEEAPASRRLLGADDRLLVPVSVACDAEGECAALQAKLNGLQCNGQLGAVLSGAFEMKVWTPECPTSVFKGTPKGITFPEAFPNSVRHWLLIGFLGQAVGALVCFYFTFARPQEPQMAHVMAFFACAVAMVSYYCMWAGVGVVFKTSGETPRVIFYPKYLDWTVSTPLLLTAIGVLGHAESPVLLALVGNDVLMVFCGLVGASLIAPYKYIWWIMGLSFFVVIVFLLMRVVAKNPNRTLRSLTVMLLITWALYPIVWITGSEGTGVLGLSQEVGLTALLDLVSKVAFGILLITQSDRMPPPASRDSGVPFGGTKFAAIA